MLIAALLALAAGAVAGIFLATRHFLRKRLPASVALFHGLGGATGFALVLLTFLNEPAFEPVRYVLFLLIATVLLGAANLVFHIRGVRHRTSLILLHGLFAVTSAGLLIRALWLHGDLFALGGPPAPTEQPAAVPAEVASAPPPPATAAIDEVGLPAGSAATAQATAADAAPTASEGAPSGEPPKEGFVVDETVRQALDRPIAFDSASANVSQESLATLADIADKLKARPEVRLIEVQGHADERGTDGRNVALTRARAAAVVSALVESGVERKRLRSAGYGARCPKDAACQTEGAPDSCHTPESWQADRRVIFVVLEVEKAAFQGEVVCARGAPLIPPEHRRFQAGGVKNREAP